MLFVGNVGCRFINGMKAQGTELKDAKVVFYGAGSSAVGVATTIASLLVKEAGLTKEEALKVCGARKAVFPSFFFHLGKEALKQRSFGKKLETKKHGQKESFGSGHCRSRRRASPRKKRSRGTALKICFSLFPCKGKKLSLLKVVTAIEGGGPHQERSAQRVQR